MSLDGIHVVGDIAGNLGRRESAKELAQGLLLLLGIGRVAVSRASADNLDASSSPYNIIPNNFDEYLLS